MKNVLSIGLGVLALAIFVVISGTFYTLEEGEQAIIVQFGRPVGAPITEAGLHVKLPFVQDVRRFEKRLLIWDGAKGGSSSGSTRRPAGGSPTPRSSSKT
jgi:membrane protease subunit HflC